jgi:hypothetical protein
MISKWIKIKKIKCVIGYVTTLFLSRIIIGMMNKKYAFNMGILTWNSPGSSNGTSCEEHDP